MKIRILLVDDNLEFRQTAERFLVDIPGVQFIGSAENGIEALKAVVSLNPDLVLMDIVMPRMNGFEATRAIKRLIDPPQVVMLSLYNNDAYRHYAQQAGADGFLAKSELISGLENVMHQLLGRDSALGSSA